MDFAIILSITYVYKEGVNRSHWEHCNPPEEANTIVKAWNDLGPNMTTMGTGGNGLWWRRRGQKWQNW